MKDIYPDYLALPAANLVPPDRQPEYLELPGQQVGARSNVADLLVDAQVRQGRAKEIATIHHEAGRAYTFDDLRNASLRLACVARFRLAARRPSGG